ncbi:MerR family transcriptional regulator [Thermoactinospora rubra]|uniref:MerR family transcriptional regulator n=1 Tax=Thermoactinospora rubra TaxID=1088767 RepID=UPI000A0F97A6|nr:MerR family transcriptional regulator [Thermoactinospora rubra]
MRIGELAALAGVSTRAVRHYHHLGLLPEPGRLANGYRSYGLRHAVELARIRRLSELGLSLEEVRDVLADDRGRDLREVLAELEADLARQEEQIRARRARIAQLLAREELHPDDPVSPDMAELFGRLPRPAGGLLAREREWLALLDVAASPDDRRELARLLGELADDPAYVERVHRVYGMLDQVCQAGDPRIPGLAEELLALVPPGADVPGGQVLEHSFARAFLADLTPGQAEVLRRVFDLAARRAAGPSAGREDG